jgi:putative intracellular protease/amidase
MHVAALLTGYTMTFTASRTLGCLLAMCFCICAPAARSAPGLFDPEAALRGVNFDPAITDGNGMPDGHNNTGNGILDADEMALVAAVVNDPSFDRSATGGASHAQVRATFDAVLSAAAVDLAPLLDRYPTAAHMVTGYLMIGTDESIDSISHMVAMFGAPLKANYDAARAMARFFGPEGDADGDGVSNRAEHAAAAAASSDYAEAASNPDIQAAGEAAMPTATSESMTVGIVLYPGFEVLDVFGPVEMWSYVPGFELIYVAGQAGPVKSAQGAVVLADHGFDDAPELDILMVPGGFGTIPELENARLIEYIRTANRSTVLTTSVCTGSALLAKAGVLDGLRATSNKRFFSLAAKQSDKVQWVVPARWMEDGKFFTSSGVSAGTDMALAVVARLQGIEKARQLARSVEYEWHEDANDDPFARYADWPPH